MASVARGCGRSQIFAEQVWIAGPAPRVDGVEIVVAGGRIGARKAAHQELRELLPKLFRRQEDSPRRGGRRAVATRRKLEAHAHASPTSSTLTPTISPVRWCTKAALRHFRANASKRRRVARSGAR